MFSLKTYQQRSLEALHDYLTLARTMGAKKAFIHQTDDAAYHIVSQMPDLPYVCLRIPTGGGKTLVACHAIATITQEFLRQEQCVVLWLAPTNTIKEQTLKALRDKQHPYRQALDTALGYSVNILDLTQAQYANRAKFDSGSTIIVSTFAALRVEDTNGRKVYEQNGYLMSHFTDLPDEVKKTLDCHDDGMPISSLANVFRLRRPILIIDEAHNARTPLSFDTLTRFAPSCALELTATPYSTQTPSNVLYHVSAYELKAESMIKMPIHLETRSDWKATILAAIEKRAELEQLADKERAVTGEYLRPITLIQAEPQRKDTNTITVETVRAALIDLNVPADQIAIETGTQSDLNGTNVLSETCPVRFIITVDKLREGWDCPFAYLLCSVRDLRSRTAIEQILGRVLRMPKATKKTLEPLNAAFAFVTSQQFAQAALMLGDALIANGFTRYEAKQEIKQEQFDPEEMGLFSPVPTDKAPSERGEKFEVPQLAFRFMDELEPLDESHFSGSAISLDGYDAQLTEEDFPSMQQVAKGVLDVDVHGRQKLGGYEFALELQQKLEIMTSDDIATTTQLVVWLDRHVPHRAITQKQAQRFLNRLVSHLLDGRGFTLEQLSRMRLALRDAATLKIQKVINDARHNRIQQTLFEAPSDSLIVSQECVFPFTPEGYAPNRQYEGKHQYKKHFYPNIGKMDSDEEANCAATLDALASVDFWVRNLVRTPNSFALPISTGRFYPDFLAKLKDGRVLAVEYKGKGWMDTTDSHEKEKIGQLWQQRSGGQCLFLFVGAQDYTTRLQNLPPVQ